MVSSLVELSRAILPTLGLVAGGDPSPLEETVLVSPTASPLQLLAKKKERCWPIKYSQYIAQGWGGPSRANSSKKIILSGRMYSHSSSIPSWRKTRALVEASTPSSSSLALVAGLAAVASAVVALAVFDASGMRRRKATRSSASSAETSIFLPVFFCPEADGC